MNVIAKTKPFPKRKPPLLPQATGSAETFVRYVTAQAHAQLLRVDPLAVANSRWPADKSVRDIIRAVSEPPADLSNTPALAVVATDFVESLKPISAAAQLMSNGLLLSFDRYARIVLPDFTALDDLPTPFVGSGQAAPVAEMAAQATALDPYKIEVIITVTKETILGGNADRLIGDALKRQAAFALDKVLFDAHPGDATRPPGLRASARLAESVALDNFTAMMQDVGRLVGAAEHIAAASPFFFIARSRRITAMRTMMKVVASNLTLLPSAAAQALPESALLCVVPLALASAVGLPEVELVEHASVEMNDAPGSADLMRGQSVRSLFQTDTVGIKLRIPASWALRNPAGANWLTAIWPSDIGGGGEGMPEAPFDEFTYGRHQGGWSQVVDEPPSTPPTQAYVRLTPGASQGWFPLDSVLLNYAPLASPAFFGTPTAPHPPPGDASGRLATTQFVRDNAGGGPGGGVEEVPETNGAYARLRGSTGATWMDFNTLRVASLDNPVFANGALTNVGIGLGDNLTGLYRSGNLIAFAFNGSIPMQVMTTSIASFVPINVPDATADAEAVNRRSADARYLQRSGGQMTGALISAPGSGPTNPGLAIGDNATGFYRDGTTLVISALGDPHMQFFSNRTAQLMFPLSMSNGVISVLGDATAADHALNRRVGDARYLQQAGGFVTGALQLLFTPSVPNDAVTKGYVDQRRAPPLLFDIPVDYPIQADGNWHTLYAPTFPIPRGGNSLVMVSLSCNMRDVQSIMFIAARIYSVTAPTGPREGPERQIWAYGGGPGSLNAGFTVNLYAEVSGDNPTVSIELKVLDGGASAQPRDFTVLGGGPAVSERSQVCFVDLGPR